MDAFGTCGGEEYVDEQLERLQVQIVRLQQSASFDALNNIVEFEIEEEVVNLQWVSSTQRWWHSCCDDAALTAALASDWVTAIESDVVYSHAKKCAVMAHPPATDSNLTFARFVDRCAFSKKHLKIDFKDPAVVPGCLALLHEYAGRFTMNGQCIWLNADVLSAGQITHFDADQFVRACATLQANATLSLGWRVNLLSEVAYTVACVEDMVSLAGKHGLSERFVVAASIRMCAANPTPLKSLLMRLPKVEILLWTGCGEPAVGEALLTAVREALLGDGVVDPSRLAFDVQLTSTSIGAAVNDAALTVARAWHAKKQQHQNQRKMERTCCYY